MKKVPILRNFVASDENRVKSKVFFSPLSNHLDSFVHKIDRIRSQQCETKREIIWKIHTFSLFYFAQSIQEKYISNSEWVKNIKFYGCTFIGSIVNEIWQRIQKDWFFLTIDK